MLLQKAGIPIFSAAKYSFVKMHHSFLNSSTDGHLGCFQLLAIVISDAMNLGMHKLFWIGVLGFHPVVELLGKKAIPFLVF